MDSLKNCGVHLMTRVRLLYLLNDYTQKVKIGHSHMVTHLMTVLIYNCTSGLNYDQKLRTTYMHKNNIYENKAFQRRILEGLQCQVFEQWSYPGSFPTVFIQTCHPELSIDSG